MELSVTTAILPSGQAVSVSLEGVAAKEVKEERHEHSRPDSQKRLGGGEEKLQPRQTKSSAVAKAAGYSGGRLLGASTSCMSSLSDSDSELAKAFFAVRFQRMPAPSPGEDEEHQISASGNAAPSSG
eukprot:TRINITY_DN40926_c0_g1_i1.p1 TRINITY_DN40926_c0_g1~~TRINITY_DN40926_c0_g1_i1.p1  ORF type:complete len:127 (-),score=25.88 TRINITY_DN40926_c0_g1_i1:158-538(-)